MTLDVRGQHCEETYGGLTYGIPKNLLTVPSEVPTNDPLSSCTVGGESKRFPGGVADPELGGGPDWEAAVTQSRKRQGKTVVVQRLRTIFSFDRGCQQTLSVEQY